MVPDQTVYLFNNLRTVWLWSKVLTHKYPDQTIQIYVIRIEFPGIPSFRSYANIQHFNIFIQPNLNYKKRCQIINFYVLLLSLFLIITI